MKAVQINAYGGPEVLEINNNASTPSPGKKQLLIEVYAASINPFDFKVITGYMQSTMPLKFPTTMGGDFSGVVTTVGDEVTDFKTGDQVYGTALVFAGGSGAFAEYATANATNIAHKPQKASFEEAAALPLVGSSVVQAIEEHIKLQSGQKILIHGGAGGIGHIAVQLAKAFGAYVATTVNPHDVEFMKALGADKIIDYKSEQFETIIKDFDAVFDTVGGESMTKSLQVLKRGGILVSMLGKPDDAEIEKYGVIAIGQGTKTNLPHLQRLAEYVDSSKVKVNVDKILPIDQVREAFKYQKETHPRGKIVLKIKA